MTMKVLFHFSHLQNKFKRTQTQVNPQKDRLWPRWTTKYRIALKMNATVGTNMSVLITRVKGSGLGLELSPIIHSFNGL